MDADGIPVRMHGTAKARAGEDDGELTGPGWAGHTAGQYVLREGR